jgi:hypothetical protein
MLVLFCLRLAAGMLACLLLLSPAQINPRFYRTHFVVALGLAAAAAVLGRETAGPGLWVALAAGMALALAGFFAWSLEGAPLGRTLIAAAAASLGTALALAEVASEAPGALGWRLGADAASAALLGSATTAMLMGHSYLIAPAMSLAPLMRLLAALAGSLLVRMALAAAALAAWCWTSGRAPVNLEEETLLWLALRWGLGFLAPLVLGGMAWQTARIRSTQSATGILYVVVVFCFLGELIGQLLEAKTGFAL